MKRAGFIINSRVPEFASFGRGMRPQGLLVGWDDAASPMSFMRFRWIADALRESGAGWRYELYRPWRRYDAVVFLKSMGPSCLSLARRLRSEGVCVIFEANVDYYTRFEGQPRLDVMAPTPGQRADAIAMTEGANAVIASSRHLAGVCAEFQERTRWVPDNVNLRLRPARTQTDPFRNGCLQVWWSGMAAKLFEFLAAERAFITHASRIHLQLVTDDLEKARQRWPASVRDRLEQFLARVPHTLHRFRDIPHLLELYSRGGVIVSPRFLDTPYNLSHSEWKISLGMACGLPAIASPVPSYADVAAHAQPAALALCAEEQAWTTAIEAALAGPNTLRKAGQAAARVVELHYETSVVAKLHSDWLDQSLAGLR